MRKQGNVHVQLLAAMKGLEHLLDKDLGKIQAARLKLAHYGNTKIVNKVKDSRYISLRTPSGPTCFPNRPTHTVT